MLSWIFFFALLGSPAVERDIVYREVAGQRLMIDVFRPDPRPPRPVPGVLVIHGGAWVSGRRQDMDLLAQMIAREGMVAVTVSYRLAPAHRWPAQLEDVQAAVRYVRAQASRWGIDPRRIGAAGASAGGHLALFLGVRDTWNPRDPDNPRQSSRVQAVFNIFGPTDLTRDFDQRYDPLYLLLLGRPRQEAAEEIRRASPVTYIDRGDAPVYILHGELDEVVPVAQGRWLEERLRKAGVPVVAEFPSDMRHSLDLRNPEEVARIERGVKWLKEVLTRRRS